MPDEPFGRQPQPVKVTFDGDARDVNYYLGLIRRYIENSSYDVTTQADPFSFTIHPRAVND